jgi:hypothetical protein
VSESRLRSSCLPQAIPTKLDYNARLAEADWRDVLVFSGLGDDDWPARLDDEFGPPNFANS